MKQERIERMPDWPARMGEKMAADYLGISASTLRLRVTDGTYPAPVREGVRRLWARAQLDRFIAAQFGLPLDGGPGAGPSGNSWDDVT